LLVIPPFYHLLLDLLLTVLQDIWQRKHHTISEPGYESRTTKTASLLDAWKKAFNLYQTQTEDFELFVKLQAVIWSHHVKKRQ
jgi:hypothetical protein